MKGDPGLLDSGSVSAIVQPGGAGQTTSLPQVYEAIGLSDR